MFESNIKFLPLKYEGDNLLIYDPYIKGVMEYLNKSKLEFKYIEAKVIIATQNIEETNLDMIIKIIKKQRDERVQKEIIKNYL